MTTSTTKFALITAAILAITALAGCSATGIAPAATPNVTVTAAATDAPADTSSVALGGILTDAQVKALGKDYENPDRG